MAYGEVDAVVGMLNDVHIESPTLSVYSFSREQAKRTIMGLASREDALTIVAYLDGELIGCMGAIITPQLTSNVNVASELLLYIKPEHRGSRAAIGLVQAFEQWAAGYDKRVGSSLGINDRGVINFYKNMGYEQSGLTMSKGASGVR